MATVGTTIETVSGKTFKSELSVTEIQETLKNDSKQTIKVKQDLGVVLGKKGLVEKYLNKKCIEIFY